jgi:hypothetical protein
LLLIPAAEGTKVVPASSLKEIKALVDGGMSVGQAVLPRTNPPEAYQMTLI